MSKRKNEESLEKFYKSGGFEKYPTVYIVGAIEMFSVEWLGFELPYDEGSEHSYDSDVREAYPFLDLSDTKDWIDNIEESGNPTVGQIIEITKSKYMKLTNKK